MKLNDSDFEARAKLYARSIVDIERRRSIKQSAHAQIALIEVNGAESGGVKVASLVALAVEQEARITELETEVGRLTGEARS